MPSEEEEQKKNVLEVIAFENDRADVVNGSPFCVKVALYLKVAEVPHAFPKPKPGDMGPTGKLPYAKFDGEKVPDSANIIAKVRERGYDVDAGLDDAQKVQSRLIVATLEDRFYFGGLYLNWQHPQNWPLTKQQFFGALPQPLKWMFSRGARKATIKALHGQGMGRRPLDEIVALNNQVVDDLAALLGDQPNFFNTPKLTTADIVAYAMLDKLVYPPLPFNPIADHIKSKPNLVAFLDNINEQYFPDVHKARKGTKAKKAKKTAK
mmetsp:Transcript_19719/g.61015  ORF Transcript_19719/g.61015 Transcript_19719/m.61015 type:complete len:265 (-) Transcript_19719:170-964(-)